MKVPQGENGKKLEAGHNVVVLNKNTFLFVGVVLNKNCTMSVGSRRNIEYAIKND